MWLFLLSTERLVAPGFSNFTLFTIICILWHQKPGGVYIYYCIFFFQGIKRCVNEVGVGFMMSANYHPAMKIVKPVRKKLKIKTVFNILGPLLNPARVPYAVIGVYHENIVSSLFISSFLLVNHQSINSMICKKRFFKVTI
jgi:hypothetical protein